MRLLVLLPLLALALAHPTSELEKRQQPNVTSADPIPLTPLTWGEVNFISTTDTHGWLEGHLKEASYSGDFGDFASFVTHMREQAVLRRKDLFVVDSGDLHDGAGLSDATALDGQLSQPIFSKVKYDALTIGNHELYVDDVAYDTYKNFAPQWKGRYLTSNVFIRDAVTNQTVPIGNLHTTFKGKFGTKVKAYGFMYNFVTAAGSASTVEPSTVTVKKQWFLDSLKEDVDMYLVTGHTPIRWAETTTVVKAIRAAHPSKPITVLGGHTHVRDFYQYDARAYGLMAGRYMESIGWMSINGVHDPVCRRNETACVGKNLTVTRRYLDANVHTYKTHSLAHPKQRFDTWQGREMTKEITSVRESLKLSEVYGCAPQSYYLNRYPATHPDSLMKLVSEKVLPVVINATRPNPAMVIINSGSQRFDLFKGPFTYDDTFIVSPFHDDFAFATVPLSIAKKMVAALNGAPFQKRREEVALDEHRDRHKDVKTPTPAVNYTLTPGYVTNDAFGLGGDDTPHTAIPYVAQPNYISSALPTGADTDMIDLIWLSFFSNLVGPILTKLDPSTTYPVASYRADMDTNTMWVEAFKKNWPC